MRRRHCLFIAVPLLAVSLAYALSADGESQPQTEEQKQAALKQAAAGLPMDVLGSPVNLMAGMKQFAEDYRRAEQERRAYEHAEEFGQ